MRLTIFLSILIGSAFGQNPFEVAKDHYKLEFENEWVRVSRVTYGPHTTAPVHDHPSTPAFYIYTTDAGPILFKHDVIGPIRRPAVKAGQIRYAIPSLEKHEVEYLGDTPSEYIRVELKTEPIGIPPRDFRSKLESHAMDAGISKIEFENGQVRIIRMYCAAQQECPAPEHPEDAAVLVYLPTRQVRWIAAGAHPPITQTGDYVRLELKSKPVV